MIRISYTEFFTYSPTAQNHPVQLFNDRIIDWAEPGDIFAKWLNYLYSVPVQGFFINLNCFVRANLIIFIGCDKLDFL